VSEAAPLLELDVGAAAAGGSCVARHEGRVVFVRHALPGERVLARVTEDRGGSYLRADAVHVVLASPDRVPEPCPHARPGRCGGCDWQHATPEAQRRLKRSVIVDQFARIAHLEVGSLLSAVEPLPGGMLGWRTRTQFAVDQRGRPGLHKHRSAEIELLDACPLTVPGLDAVVLGRRWPGFGSVEVAAGEEATPAVLGHRAAPRGRDRRRRRAPQRAEQLAGPDRLEHRVAGRRLLVSAAGFWQVHPHALEAFTAAVLDGLRPQPGETVLELYAGAGALTVALAEAVGATGRIVGLEGGRDAVADAGANLREQPWAEVRHAAVDAGTVAGCGLRPDLVVLDPPRTGAGPAVLTAIDALGPRAVGYVACDPAPLARDVRAALDHGWTLAALRAFDAFPMTAHVECFALLVPAVTTGS
jgi:tRNA/tmRNA/rRNA uracil-C5-methylase (TrmA/RlmC/RlmD family)